MSGISRTHAAALDIRATRPSAESNSNQDSSNVPIKCYRGSLNREIRLSDLSSIEHVWDIMRMRLQLPRRVDDLARQLEQNLQGIPQATIRMLYHSIPRCVVVCIRARGKSPSY
ncbi:hypothetical protein TNCV_1684891 [Trichonephila clavipes]|nr:hypothetical protein TNCV_1684891 [Trichonephila clavipes]